MENQDGPEHKLTEDETISESHELKAVDAADEFADLVLPTQEERDKAEQLLRQMQVAKLRGQGTIAQKLLDEAKEIAPNFSLVHEAIGDELVERKQFRKAKESFLFAHKLDPLNKEVENKYGEMVLRVDLHIDPTLMLEADAGTMASGRAAVVLNLLMPGLGHMVLERYVTGGILMAIWFGCWIVALGTPGGMAGLFSALGVKQSTSPLNPIVPIALLVAVVVWILSLGLASGAAKGMTPRKTDKPIPPAPMDY